MGSDIGKCTFKKIRIILIIENCNRWLNNSAYNKIRKHILSVISSSNPPLMYGWETPLGIADENDNNILKKLLYQNFKIDSKIV